MVSPCGLSNALYGDVLHLFFPLKQRSSAKAVLEAGKEKVGVDRKGGVGAGVWPGVGKGRFGNIGVELTPSDPLSLILSPHDRKRQAPVDH